MQRVNQVNRLTGTMRVPGDKSISHRAVMFGAMAEGRTSVSGFLPGEDCLSTIQCFRRLGVTVQHDEPSKLVIISHGLEQFSEPSEVLEVGNSGTTIRLLMGILAGRPFSACLQGDDSIAKRPMKRVTSPLRLMGARIDGRQNGDYTPIHIRGGELKGITYQSPVASAQVKSAVLLAGLQASGYTQVIEPYTSRDHTERMLQAFGVKLEVSATKVTIAGGQTLQPSDVKVPGDFSSAAFFIAAAAMVKNSELRICDVGINPTRTGLIDVMRAMGADIALENPRVWSGEPVSDILVKFSGLQGVKIEGALIPRLIDELPIIAVLATQAEGETVIRDAAELRVKETDRIATVTSELSKLGADIEALPDGMIIRGKAKLHGAVCHTYGDHRIGMALAIAGLIADGDTVIEGEKAVDVSFPAFFELLKGVCK